MNMTGRWHPSRATDEDQRRLRACSEEFWHWMYGSSVFARYWSSWIELERREPEHPDVRPMNMVLIRRLEAPCTPTTRRTT